MGLVLASLCITQGCSNLIGLNGYSVGGLGSVSEAGPQGNAGNSGEPAAGSTASAGAAGDSLGESGEGGTASAGEAGSVGNSGAAGKPGACAGNCDDDNECTDDNCLVGKCVHQPAAVTTPCGMGQTCDAEGVCVRCLDTAPGTRNDMGCPATAPVCVGTGVDAVCGGCTKASDCADTNDCTTEQCTDSKCVISAVGAGQVCSVGVCNGAAPEKCLACADTATAGARDVGCTAAKPVCDPMGTGTCYACTQDSDCATDNVSCTVETCANHVCTHVATDSKCMSVGDVCKPNRCDAAAGCKQVDIGVANALMTDDPNLGNGSFENAMDMGNAVGWTNTGDDAAIIYDCTGTAVPASGGCRGSVGTTYQDGGNFVAWLGGTTFAAVDKIDHQLNVPAGTTTLQIFADMNMQTVNAGASNNDSFDVLLLDASPSRVPIGSPVVSFTNASAQTSAPKWTVDAINKTVNASAQAGKKIYIRLQSSVDATFKTDFFIDNVRVVATVCQ